MGYALSYLYLRAVVRAKHDRDWILIEKLVVIAISLYSWVVVFALALVFIFGSLIKIDFDKKVKW